MSDKFTFDKSGIPENGDKDDSVNNGRHANGGDEDGEHDPYFPPVVSLPEVETPTGEESEKEVFKMRSKLFRFDSGNGTAEDDPEHSPPEWKERGTGDVKILHNEANGRYRLLMRRDKTLKVCANHFVRPWMILKPMKGSNDKAWMWQVHADFADEEPKTEVFAIRFGSPENAQKFKSAFDDAVIQVIENEALVIRCQEESEESGADAAAASGDDKGKDAAAAEVTKDMGKLDLKKK